MSGSENVGRKTKVREVTLTPVVEFEPFDYGATPRCAPSSPNDGPEAWDHYWRTCLRDSGIDIVPYCPGSWMVPIAHIIDAHVIDALLHNALDEKQSVVDPFAGGYVFSSTRDELAPGCCGDLSNLDDWREAIVYRASDWKMIWIGHPWVDVRADGDMLTFLPRPEYGPPVSAFAPIRREDLAHAIEDAARLVKAFGERLRPRIEEMGWSGRADEVLARLVGGLSLAAEDR